MTNPDKRCEIIKDYARANFKDNTILKFTLAVEQGMFVLFKKVSLFSTFESLLPLSVIILVTTKKKANLILNVDGCIAACFVDMLRSCGAFTMEEAAELVQNGCLNGMFVLGRSIGFIGHHLDQKRLKQGLYRHPWDDISYLNDSA